MRRWVFPGLLLLCLALFVVLNSVVGVRQRAQSLSPSSGGVTGLSILDKVGQKLGHEAITSLRKQIYHFRDVQSFDAFFALSPKQSYSNRELNILYQYVNGGGNVVVSMHNDSSRANVQALLVRFGVSAKWKESPEFRNRTPLEVRTSEEVWPFEPGRTYSVYSRYVFDSDECSSFDKVQCVFLTKKVGEGSLSLFLGYPPIMNGLFGNSDNWSLGVAFLSRYKTIAIDDFRNFFSDKTVWDLVVEPAFALPMFGLLGAIVIFFLFGRLSYDDAVAGERHEVPQLGSVHAFQEEVFQGIVGSVDMQLRFDRHAAFLVSLFPEAESQVREGKSKAGGDPIAGIRNLVELHKSLLRKRGMKI